MLQSKLEAICEDNTKMKTCSKCGEIKLEAKFSKNQSKCKECDKKYREQHTEDLKLYKKQHYKLHADSIKKRSNQYYAEHTEDKKQYGREYYAKHSEELKISRKPYAKQHYEQNREQILQRQKQLREQNIEKDNQRCRLYYAKNVEKESQRHKLYRSQNLESVLQREKLYKDTHPEEVKLSKKRYADRHKGERKPYFKQYRKQHAEERAQATKQYFKTPRGKEVRSAAHAKRRALGYNPINSTFENAAYHHLRHKKETGEIDNDIGIYIPSTLHASMYHNGNTGQNMEIMNKLALEWYLSNTPAEKISSDVMCLYQYYQALGVSGVVGV